jgi:alkaline phosphatase D
MRRFAWVALLSALTTTLGFATNPKLTNDQVLSKIVFGSCADQNKPCPVWSAVSGAKPELMLLLGDNVYCDIENGKLIDPDPEQIAKSYAALAKVEAFTALKTSVPMLATWDDHDFGKNDAGTEWKHKDVAKKLFMEFVEAGPDDPRWKRSGIYDSTIVGPQGKRVQIILLDNRYNLTVPKKGPRQVISGYGVVPIAPYIPSFDEGMTVLGDEQWAWLKEQLLMPAEVRLICSGIQILAEEHPFEKWANIPKERQRLFDVINETKANGVVLLSGDRHLGEILCKTDALTYPLFEATASGWNQGSKNWRPPEKSKYRIGGMPYGDHFGMVQIDWTQDNPRITLLLRDEFGETAMSHSFRLGMLVYKQDKKAPKDEKPKDEPKRPEGVISAAEALTKAEGTEIQVQFTVVGGRAVSMGKRILLNSDKDFNNEKNFTVAVNEKAMTGVYDKATFDTFKGKVIRVKGKLTKFQGKLQIQVDSEKMIEIVKEEKKEEKKDEKKDEKKSP